MDAHPEYPPTLPQFVALCKACAPRAVYVESLPPARPTPEIAKKALAAIRTAQATKPLPSGLDLLKQAIADAVGCAGGNEAAELARLDRMFPGVQA